VSRALRLIVHNWPLKLAAVLLASVLYGGLVLGQTSRPFNSNVPIQTANAPGNVIVLTDLGAVTHIDYVAPPDLGLRVDSSSFRATVDLAEVTPTGEPATLDVAVEAIDPRVQVVGFEPRRIIVTIDRVGSKTVPIRAILGAIPSGLDVGVPTVEGTVASVSGPESIISRVAEVQARISVDASGIDVNRLVDLLPVDASGEPQAPIDVEPAQVRVRVAVFTDRQTRTLPVTPVVVGTPAAGFEVASVVVDPLVISVEGDANDLAGLDRADTKPVSISGASSQVSQSVGLELPDGVQALGSGTVQVTIGLRPVTGTRTFEAGLVLVGAQSDRTYALSTDRVVVTIGGSVADLDRLSGSTIVLSVDVTGLEDGVHTVPVTANLNTGLTLLGASPNPIQVTVSSLAASPAPSPGPSATS
jgi:YbbR domain-containing protein